MNIAYEILAKLKGIKAILYCFAHTDNNIIDADFAFMILGQELDSCINALESSNEK